MKITHPPEQRFVNAYDDLLATHVFRVLLPTEWAYSWIDAPIRIALI